MKTIFSQMEEERKAWDALCRYKFEMYGYHASRWVMLNKLTGKPRPNPWSGPGVICQTRDRIRKEARRETTVRLAGQAKAGFYPTPPRVTGMIANLITPAEEDSRAPGVLRILDPCCGAGEAAAQLADGLRERSAIPIETYGVELHRERAQAAAAALDRSLSADLFSTSIANEAFGVLFLNPPYDHDQEKKRTEHAFLTHSTLHLRKGGLLVFIVPRARLGTSARFLSAHYEQVRLWDFPSPEREAFGQAVLMGHRRAEPLADPRTENEIHRWAREEAEGPEYPDRPAYRALTAPGGGVLFTNRSVDPVLAVSEARQNGLWNSPKITGSLRPPENARTRPLMPLRRGHLAMLIAAGFLNNLCLQDPEGRRILVKGRTEKKTVLAEETETSEVYRDQLRTTVTVLDLGSGEISSVTTQAEPGPAETPASAGTPA